MYKYKLLLHNSALSPIKWSAMPENTLESVVLLREKSTVSMDVPEHKDCKWKQGQLRNERMLAGSGCLGLIWSWH